MRTPKVCWCEGVIVVTSFPNLPCGPAPAPRCKPRACSFLINPNLKLGAVTE